MSAETSADFATTAAGSTPDSTCNMFCVTEVLENMMRDSQQFGTQNLWAKCHHGSWILYEFFSLTRGIAAAVYTL